MRIGFDYSWSRPSPSALRAAGASFVVRYLSHDSSKNLDGVPGVRFPTGELHSLHAVGLGVVGNWETTETRALGGYLAGAADAAEAQRQARMLGAPAGWPIYFSCDWDVQPDELGQVERYLNGAASVLGRERVGVYGGRRVVTAMFDRGAVAYGWQTYAWSSGQWEPRAQLRQVQNGVHVGGAEVDRCEAHREPFGAWLPLVPRPPAPAPAPDPRPRWWRWRPFLAEWLRSRRRPG